jgi:glutathione S-transferase
MKHEIILYGHGTTRSARCEWTLRELGLDYQMVDAIDLVGSERLRAIHPQSKIPAAAIDGHPLFESAALCTYFCDLAPEKDMIGKPGTRERALHDQWSYFMYTEMEGWLWSNFKHMGFYPEEKRVPAVVEHNFAEFRGAAKVFDEVLAGTPFLIGGNFSVTDIIVGWTVNWARRMDQLEDFPNLRSYIDRLFARELCTFNKE